jgi:hypothetical protein
MKTQMNKWVKKISKYDKSNIKEIEKAIYEAMIVLSQEVKDVEELIKEIDYIVNHYLLIGKGKI